MGQKPRERPTRVLVFGTQRLQKVASAAAAIEGLPPLELCPTDDPRAASAAVDVILSDRDVPAAEMRAAIGKRRRAVAQVFLGIRTPQESSAQSSSADSPFAESLSRDVVLLPADLTPREIRLACVLAADAARWRRRLDRRWQKEKRLRRLSFADPLTGVGNLRAWNARLAAACRRVRDEGAAVCLALFDVDRFKDVNDTFGHAAGDDVLRGVAERLSAGVREGDFVGRIGGDEFGLILANLAAEHAGKSVERVRQELSTAYRASTGATVDVTASAGWCLLVAGDPADAAVQRADAALRTAKRLGRNQAQAADGQNAGGGEGERSA